MLSKAQAVRVRNVMNPLLWQNAVAMPALIVAAYLFREQPLLSTPMGLGAVALPLWTMWEYRFFARNDPKRLQSEEYLIESERLMIQSKSSSQAIDARTLPSGGNPELIPFEEVITLPSMPDSIDEAKPEQSND